MPLAGLAGVGALATASAPASAAGTPPATIVNVGPQRSFTTLQAAMSSIVDASAGNRYVIVVDPGVYDVAAAGSALVLKEFVSIVGTDRLGTMLYTRDALNIRANSNARISNLSVFHGGQTTGVGAIQSSVFKLTDFLLESLTIHVDGPGAAIASDRQVGRAEIRDVTILTQAEGIAIRAGGWVYLHDVNIHLHGDKGPHTGILADKYCRIFVFGGKIGTGYGYPDVTHLGQSVIGLLTLPTFKGRVVMHGVWSICRNEGATGAGVYVNCVRVTGTEAFVRVFGGYFQAENSRGGANTQTFSNPGTGRIETYGSRARDYGDGPIYSSNQIGRQLLTTANNGLVFVGDSGGLVMLDASAGSFRVSLPADPTETEQYIFKKVDPGAGVIEISGNGKKIDGQTSVFLSRPYDKLHVRFCYGQFLIVG